MSYKKWVRYFILIIVSTIFIFGLFNYTIDPLWTFCHSNKYNNAQPGFNERQLKTNRAYFCGLKQYNALLLGSSRTTYINQHDFKTLKVFNYSSVAFGPSEYKAWIDLAKKIKGSDFNTLIIGIDFFGSNSGPLAQQHIKETPQAIEYFNTTSSFLYRYKMLFILDTFYKSMESIKHVKQLGTIDYTRDNIKRTIKVTPERKQAALNHQIPLYANMVYDDKMYRYDKKLKEYLLDIKNRNPNSRFIIFTTPVNIDLFSILVKKNRLPDYKKWLTQYIDVFGEVYDFMGTNSITKNRKNYADLHHFYPEIGTLIADRITQVKNRKLLKDFGILVNKENLEAHFKEIDKQVSQLYQKD